MTLFGMVLIWYAATAAILGLLWSQKGALVSSDGSARPSWSPATWAVILAVWPLYFATWTLNTWAKRA